MTQCTRTLFVASLTLALVAPAFAADPDPNRFIVGFANDNGRAAASVAGERLLDLPNINAAAMRLSPAAVMALAKNPNVAFVEQDAPRYMMSQSTPWGITAVQATQLSDIVGNRTVCIIDSGYSANHEDLPSGVTGYNGNLPWDQDGFGHGTHVAGTIAAVNNSVGVVGVARPSLYIVRVFGNDGAWAYSSSLVDAAYRCRDGGANVISMSLGGSLSSNAENNAFTDLNNNFNILSIAAAGNDGNTRKSYPASYAAVMSVAAVDSALVVADFSQQNSAVEIAAPGVTVRSTVPMGAGFNESATVGTTGYEVVAMELSANGTGSGALVDCGIAGGAGFSCPGASGKVCLIERGTFSFEEKTNACAAGGGVAAIIFNNAAGLFSGTLGVAGSIPSVSMSQADGLYLRANQIGTSSTVAVASGNYAFYQGTSMATPHVSGVAALIWSLNPGVSNQCVRDAMDATALDLGTAGKDNAYGWGFVQAVAANNYIVAGTGSCGGGGGPTCSPSGASCSTGSDCCSGSCKGKPGNKTCG